MFEKASLLFLLIAAQSASAEEYTCPIVEICASGAGCKQVTNEFPPIIVAIAQDGKSAVIGDFTHVETMPLLHDSPSHGRTFWTAQPASVGIATLAPDGSLTATTNERSAEGKAAAVMLIAQCKEVGT